MVPGVQFVTYYALFGTMSIEQPTQSFRYQGHVLSVFVPKEIQVIMVWHLMDSLARLIPAPIDFQVVTVKKFAENEYHRDGTLL